MSPPHPAKEESLLRDTSCHCGQRVMPHRWASPLPHNLPGRRRCPGPHPQEPLHRQALKGDSHHPSPGLPPKTEWLLCPGQSVLLQACTAPAASKATMVPEEAAVPAPGLRPCTGGAGNNGPLKASTPGPCAQAGGPSAPWPSNALQVQKEERGSLQRRGGISHSSIMCSDQYAPAHV